ncbi:MAG TPA: hypothetical protein ENK26_03140 [Gammaproteobacteria bacterium]|nr:hypothetical protein [Gammaproteobacteria bacterium]
MKLELDTEKFEEIQTVFITDLVEKIMIKLREGGIEGRQLEELTANIAFSIASAIDDTAMIESNGVAAHPYLTFRAGEDELVHCGENSYTYEFVIPILKKLFDV